MPKVKMLIGLASADWSLAPGDETDVNKETAEAWEEAGIAEIIEKPKKETATSKKKVEKRGK